MVGGQVAEAVAQVGHNGGLDLQQSGQHGALLAVGCIGEGVARIWEVAGEVVVRANFHAHADTIALVAGISAQGHGVHAQRSILQHHFLIVFVAAGAQHHAALGIDGVLDVVQGIGGLHADADIVLVHDQRMGAGVDKQRAAAIVVLLKVLAQGIQQAASALALDRSAVVVGHGGGGTVGTVHRAGTAAAGGRQHLNAKILLNPADHAVAVLRQIAVQRVADPIVGQLGGLHALELLMPELGVGHVSQVVVEGFQVQFRGLVGLIGIALAV